MTTTLTIPTISVADNVLNTINANNALVAAAYNSIDGANIQAATVANAALAKNKSFFSKSFLIVDIANTRVPVKFALPNLDGASSSNWRFLGYSINSRVLTAPVATLDIKKVAGGGGGAGVSMLAGADDFATLTAGTPRVVLVTAVALASADVITLSQAYTSGTITDTTVDLFFSQAHVGT